MLLACDLTVFHPKKIMLVFECVAVCKLVLTVDTGADAKLVRSIVLPVLMLVSLLV